MRARLGAGKSCHGGKRRGPRGARSSPPRARVRRLLDGRWRGALHRPSPLPHSRSRPGGGRPRGDMSAKPPRHRGHRQPRSASPIPRAGKGESAMQVAHLAESAHGPTGTRQQLRSSAGRRWRARLWIGLTVVGATAFILALYGSEGHLLAPVGRGAPPVPERVPRPDEPGRSSSFKTAKYLAPLVSLSLTIGIILGAYGRQMTGLRARRRRDHVVVCGLGEKGLRAARSRLGSGHKVTCIDLDVNGDAAVDLRARKALVLAGDATSGRCSVAPASTGPTRSSAPVTTTRSTRPSPRPSTDPRRSQGRPSR